MSTTTTDNKKQEIEHSIEDVESLINNILILSTLMLAFALAHLFGSLNYEEYQFLLQELIDLNGK